MLLMSRGGASWVLEIVFKDRVVNLGCQLSRGSRNLGDACAMFNPIPAIVV